MVSGYLVQGSNGETVSLSTEERLLLIKQARTFIPRNKILLAGAGCEGTMNTIKMCEEMAAAGADAVMLVSPSFYKSGLNVGVDLSVAAIRTLSQHPNICGIKDSGGDVTKLAALVHVTAGNNFQVLAGSAGYLLAALHVGCVGAICGLANVLPRELCQLFDLFVATTSGTAHAAASEALSLQRRLIEPNSAVTKTLGVPAMKFAMDIMGYYGGPTRSPLLPLLADQQEAVKTLFNEFL
ncbi:hypothetical protein HAZT_HAZT001842 [Hyalella azteca]|uniref:4-hydroxy-2-oxoglutarate aldolase, mitochondrial n=1 Tax=Hyalella azteca TaxID=294128 RepID=A0A6A0GX80_HYAAZ|nr:hypothetical protein HAZT_HAZT001842 [Hyalella azteca]